MHFDALDRDIHSPGAEDDGAHAVMAATVPKTGSVEGPEGQYSEKEHRRIPCLRQNE